MSALWKRVPPLRGSPRKSGDMSPRSKFSVRRSESARRTGPWLQFFSPVRRRQIKRGTDWNNAGRIDFGMRHVVVTLDVVEVDGTRDAGLLIQVHQVALQVWIIDDAADIAFEMAVINDVEPNERAEKSPIGFDDTIVEQITALR